MDQIESLHQQAMADAECAYLAQLKGDLAKAESFLLNAYQKEEQAARLVRDKMDLEPTRSILHRSAASLALDCGKTREAEKLIGTALAGEPPNEIAEELRELMERVQFDRHLSLHGIMLNPEEFQMSLSGNAISHGVAQSDLFVQRLEFVEKLIHRTAERMQGLPYRQSGRLTKDIKEQYGVFLSVPRAASFAVTIKISQPKQLELLGSANASKVVDDLMSSIALVDSMELSQLRDNIFDEDYYKNFVALVKSVAPDGERVSQVAFTSVRSGEERTVALRQERSAIDKRVSTPTKTLEATPVQFEGVLRFADSLHTSGKIRVVDDSGKAHTIVVPVSLMADIVRPLYEERVVVEGEQVGKEIRLVHARRATS